MPRASCATTAAPTSPSHVHHQQCQPGAIAAAITVSQRQLGTTTTAITVPQTDDGTARAAPPAGGASCAAGRGADNNAGTEGIIADVDEAAGRSPHDSGNRLALVCYAASTAKPSRPLLPSPHAPREIPPDDLPRHQSSAGNADVEARMALPKVRSRASIPSQLIKASTPSQLIRVFATAGGFSKVPYGPGRSEPKTVANRILVCLDRCGCGPATCCFYPLRLLARNIIRPGSV